MAYTVEQYVDAIWAYSSRTVDAGSPAASDGLYIDDVGYAVWTYPTRTEDGVPQNCTARSIVLGALVLGKPTAGDPLPVEASWHGQIVTMTFPGDFISAHGIMMEAVLSHVDPTMALILDSSDNEIMRIRTTASKPTKHMKFPGGLIFNGLKASTFAGGSLSFYLKP